MVSLVSPALGIGVLSHWRKRERERCNTLCSDPVSTSPCPGRKRLAPGNTSPSFPAARPPIHHLRQFWAAAAAPLPPLMTLSISWQALGPASSLTRMVIFLTQPNSLCPSRALQSYGNSEARKGWPVLQSMPPQCPHRPGTAPTSPGPGDP